MEAISYIAEEAKRLEREADRAYSAWGEALNNAWGEVLNNADYTDEQFMDASIAYFKASAAADAVKQLYLDLLAKGLV